jgi:cobalamin biosynthesis Mg chelatase CobN
VQVAEDKTQGIRPTGNSAESPSAWSYKLVVTAILSVTIAFILIMGLFAFLRVFDKDNAANITAALSSLFGIVGTLVGAYFGIKASSDAQDKSAETAQRAVTQQKETSKDAVEKTVTVASETTQKAAETSQRAAEASQRAAETLQAETLQRGRRANPMATMALATLIPVVGGASLLVLRYYLRRMQNTV